MKSERRHELEHNTLDTEISKTIGFFKKYLNRILTVVLIVLVLIVGWMWWNKRQAAKAWESQSQYDQLCLQINPDKADPVTTGKLINGFLSLSKESASPEIAANSLLQIATLYSLQGLNANESSEQKKAFGQAESYYKKVVSECSEFPVIVAGAKIGLGKLAETRNDIPEARKQYLSATKTPGIDGYPVKKLAEAALRKVDEFDGSVKMAKELPEWAQAEEDAKKKAEEEAKAEADKKALEAKTITLPADK
jgi:hypothetical protein